MKRDTDRIDFPQIRVSRRLRPLRVKQLLRLLRMLWIFRCALNAVSSGFDCQKNFSIKTHKRNKSQQGVEMARAQHRSDLTIWINEIGVVQVAKILKIKRATVYYWLAGKSLPTDYHKMKIVEITNGKVSYEDMIESQSARLIKRQPLNRR
jgi:hypothetical protein